MLWHVIALVLYMAQGLHSNLWSNDNPEGCECCLRFAALVQSNCSYQGVLDVCAPGLVCNREAVECGLVEVNVSSEFIGGGHACACGTWSRCVRMAVPNYGRRSVWLKRGSGSARGAGFWNPRYSNPRRRNRIRLMCQMAAVDGVLRVPIVPGSYRAAWNTPRTRGVKTFTLPPLPGDGVYDPAVAGGLGEEVMIVQSTSEEEDVDIEGFKRRRKRSVGGMTVECDLSRPWWSVGSYLNRTNSSVVYSSGNCEFGVEFNARMGCDVLRLYSDSKAQHCDISHSGFIHESHFYCSGAASTASACVCNKVGVNASISMPNDQGHRVRFAEHGVVKYPPNQLLEADTWWYPRSGCPCLRLANMASAGNLTSMFPNLCAFVPTFNPAVTPCKGDWYPYDIGWRYQGSATSVKMSYVVTYLGLTWSFCKDDDDGDVDVCPACPPGMIGPCVAAIKEGDNMYRPCVAKPLDIEVPLPCVPINDTDQRAVWMPVPNLDGAFSETLAAIASLQAFKKPEQVAGLFCPNQDVSIGNLTQALNKSKQFFLDAKVRGKLMLPGLGLYLGDPWSDFTGSYDGQWREGMAAVGDLWPVSTITQWVNLIRGSNGRTQLSRLAHTMSALVSGYHELSRRTRVTRNYTVSLGSDTITLANFISAALQETMCAIDISVTLTSRNHEDIVTLKNSVVSTMLANRLAFLQLYREIIFSRKFLLATPNHHLASYMLQENVCVTASKVLSGGVLLLVSPANLQRNRFNAIKTAAEAAEVGQTVELFPEVGLVMAVADYLQKHVDSRLEVLHDPINLSTRARFHLARIGVLLEGVNITTKGMIQKLAEYESSPISDISFLSYIPYKDLAIIIVIACSVTMFVLLSVVFVYVKHMLMVQYAKTRMLTRVVLKLSKSL